MAERPVHGAEGVIVISGGSRGLGYTLARSYLAHGCRVATFSRSENDDVAALRAADPGEERFLWRPVDASKAEDVRRFVDLVSTRYQAVDVLVNNAGALTEELLALTSEQQIRTLIDLNVIGAIALTQACVRLMLRRKRGSIVNISSINSIRGFGGVSVYAASKAAVDALTRSLARELGSANIRVNSVAPGFFESELVAELRRPLREKIAKRTPLGRLSRLEEIADAVLFLASPLASFITGQTLVVDGGLTC